MRGLAWAVVLGVSVVMVGFATGSALASGGVIIPPPGGGGGGGIWIPPYSWGGAWSSVGCDSYTFCGGHYIHANSANSQTGFVSDAVESAAGGWQGATADGWVEFTQNIGHPYSTGTWTLDFGWDISWSVWVSSLCYPPTGGSYAAASVVIGANAYDNANGYTVHNGDVTVTLLNSQTSCPGFVLGGGGSGGSAQRYDVTFSAYLVGGDTYTFYTWIHVSTAAVGLLVGGADAEAYVTWGTGANSYSWWMSYD